MSLGSFKINKVEIPDSLDTVCNIIETSYRNLLINWQLLISSYAKQFLNYMKI